MQHHETAKEIDRYLDENAPDPHVSALLKLCLGRVLKRFDGVWAEAFSRDDFRHISDWLSAAIIEKSPWLSRLDDLGRPKKLMKFSTVKGILAEADKAMLVFAQKHGDLKLKDGDEAVWLDLENGYVLVQLLTPAALDRESSVMQHCIGGGGYDRYLESGERTLLSLRDAYGKPHATIEAKSDGSIVQLQGKQNGLPARRYVEAMRMAFLRSDFNPSDIMDRLGFVLSSSGDMLDKFNLPSGAEIVGDLTYRLQNGDFRLPDGLTVLNSLHLHGYPHLNLPSGLTVKGGFVLARSKVERLPRDLVVLGDIEITGDAFSLPHGLHAKGDVKLMCGSFSSFPNDVVVEGSLTIIGSTFPYVPASLKVSGNVVIDGCTITGVEAGFSAPLDLTLSNCKIGSLPEGLHVGGTLDLSLSSVTDVPASATVDGSVRMHCAQITEIPRGWRIGKDIEAGSSRLASLPGRASVTGGLYLDDTDVSELGDLRFVGGDLTVGHTKVRSLPAGLVIGGDLDGTHSELQELHGDVRIGGRLILTSSKIKSLPAAFSVGGACDLSNTAIAELPEGFSCGKYLDVLQTQITKVPRGTRARQLMCDDSIVEIGDDVEFPNGIILPHVSAILSVDAMRSRLATMQAA
jgi:hypothetical protein